jgi:hypothetical protein
MMASFDFSRALVDKRHIRQIALGASMLIAALSIPAALNA